MIMNRTQTFYKFIGTEEDAKKYPDPEPIVGRDYSEDEFMKIMNDDRVWPSGFNSHWEGITKSEPIRVHDVLTKIDRIEILKVAKDQKWTLQQIEKYVAFGTYPE